MLAAQRCHTDVVQLLLEAGATVDLTDALVRLHALRSILHYVATAHAVAC